MKPSDRLAKYDSVITIKTSIGEVPLYKMMEKFLYIEDENGNCIKFILNDDQVDMYEEMCLQRLNGNPIRANVLKSRRIGFSTFFAGVIFCEVIFNKGQNAAIVADIAEHATNLFNKYIYFYEHLPSELRPRRNVNNAKELRVSWANGQHSSIRIMVQGESAGRSGTYQYLHLSECAFWKDLNKTLISLLQTVSPLNLNSMVFLETTANGYNDYKNVWDYDCGNPRSLYKAIFYAWFTDKKCQHLKPRIEYDDLEEFEREIMSKYNLTLNQMSWYDDKYRSECRGDKDMLRQEYPSNPIEAFITSGNSVFNADLIALRKEELLKVKPLKQGFFRFKSEYSLDGKMINISDMEWVESLSGAIKIYKDVDRKHPYVVSNDPALGGEDYYATQVFDNYTGEQVAVYHKNKCDADDCAFQMYCLGKYYNDAMLTGETNTTAYILQICSRCGYKNIYQDQDIEELGTRFYNKLGYKTKQNNRQTMIDMFREAFRDDPRMINDFETICEMENFQITRTATGKEKAVASGDNHDDLVMSICGYFLCRSMQRAIPFKDEYKKKDSIAEIERKVEERRRNLSSVKRVYSIWE